MPDPSNRRDEPGKRALQRSFLGGTSLQALGLCRATGRQAPPFAHLRVRWSTGLVSIALPRAAVAITTSVEQMAHATSSGRPWPVPPNILNCRAEGATFAWIFRRWGRSLTVPSLTSLPISDRHCFLACGRSDQAASSLRTEDQSALKDPAVPWGLQCRAGRPGVLLPVEVGPGFPWG